MNDNRSFLDTNVIIYAHTDLDVRKMEIAQQIISNKDTVISTQILQETANILFKKFQFEWTDVRVILNEMSNNNFLWINSGKTVSEACRVAERYGFSFYDSLVIAAAL